MKIRTSKILLSAVALALVISVASRAADEHPFKNAVIWIVRHAEKPETGDELNAEGKKRAETYAKYFTHFQLDGKPVKPDLLFAAADSKTSHRPRLTLEPLSKETGLKIDDRFKNEQVQDLVNELRSLHHAKHLLVCWHHGEIPNLIRALGGDPATLIPGGKWPGAEYGWVIQLKFNHEGKLVPGECKRIEEGF